MSTAPAAILPLILEATSWGGNDGNWSTFTIGVGTPQQDLRVLPATGHGEVWVPVPEGCTLYSSASFDCGASRGAPIINGTQGQGFATNDSSTWDQLGIYQLASAQNQYNGTGLYGLDVVTLGDGPDSLTNQTIAGIAASEFWLGSVGLESVDGNFSVLDRNVPSLLSALKAQNLTPSSSFGYTAGASYRSSPGSLILGGYDQSRFTPSDVQFPVTSGSPSLQATLVSFITTDTLQGTQAMPVGAAGLTVVVDSTVSHLALPPQMCDSLEQAFGLVYDPNTDLYLINTTAQGPLIQAQPTFTFTLAANASSKSTTNIVLPYSAFNLEVGMPYYNGSASYFPIRRALNDSQIILGRTFFQEAYLVVDWERGNFTLGQALHPGDAQNNIVPILPLLPTLSTGLGTGTIAGIAVGIVAFLAIVAATAFIAWKRRLHKHRPLPIDDTEYSDEKSQQPTGIAELHGTKKPGTELMSNPVHELHGSQKPGTELMSNPVHELQDEQTKAQLMSTPIFELPGEVVEQEMAVPGVRSKAEEDDEPP